MIRLPPRSTRTDTLFPYTTLFRSQILLRDLARRHQRESFDEIDAFGNLVASEQAAAVGNQHLFIGRMSFANDDDRLDAFAPARIGHPDDRDASAGGMSRQAIFDLRSEERRVGKVVVRTCQSRGA